MINARIKTTELSLMHKLFFANQFEKLTMVQDILLKNHGCDPKEFMITMDGWIVRKEIQP